MNKLYPSDFNVSESNPNGVWVRLNEINDMIDFEVLQVDEDKLQEYCNLRRQQNDAQIKELWDKLEDVLFIEILLSKFGL